MPDIKQCLEILRENYAVLFPPVNPIAVQQASVRLVKSGAPAVPADYVAFLAETNGLFWNGNELFSLNNLDRDKGAFRHCGLLEQAQTVAQHPMMRKRLWLGIGVEVMLVYDAGTRQYMVLDRYTYEPVQVFASLTDVLTEWVKPLQKAEG